MKRVIFILSAAFGLSVSAFAQSPSPNSTTTQPTVPQTNKSVIEFESMVVNYDTIQQYDDGVRYFKFKNTGSEPLIISRCKGSCGCTVPSCPTEVIMPGKSGTIKVKYATNRLGVINKTITVQSNASNGTQILRIKGYVKAKPQPATPATDPSTGTTGTSSAKHTIEKH